MIKAGIIGASGYAGEELLRLLATHPSVEVVAATSRNLAGKKIASVHPNLSGFYDKLMFENLSNDDIKTLCDVIFLAVPHGASMDIVPELLDKSNCKIVDLSADYRLNVADFEKIYGQPHKDPREAVYAIPEVHDVALELKNSKNPRLIANPGCFPTGATLAAAPLAKLGVLDNVIFDSKSGITGAGNTPTQTSHFPNLTENIIPYKLTSHRHLAEMKQEISRLQPGFSNVCFTPHVIPAARGIMTTAHVFTTKKYTTAEVKEIYAKYYENKPFVQLVDGVPSLLNIRGSNFCHIGIEAEAANNRIVVTSAIDNLVKGASGQAIQNMNIMFGLKETEGLWFPGLP
ncbi:N-acetyl-gamma-glutamyl-phosphate reductase [Methanosarcinaceae archaeon Ag5]|uniref:N-acetyl-gamma-glutamyl-phosphate reductase n=1 Tax=Methanolapillus africanus TaxID=3028297 RepID=A0AAE4MJZ4_9EURY|nr:N-acetyl-gamma-glutamyl-phosphate reductase [Methanosarcinaceae archaeon Ag5]